ncbi:MAG: DNA-binding protein, partial [Flavobacteriaceae bacterium]|nr:DNA-binding protein [Flavobacteriaceae bacterium]
MAIRYRITKRSNTIANNKKEQFIMQAVSTGSVNLDTISKEISNECSLTVVDVKAVLIALGIKLQFHIEEGKIVDLADIGKFKIGFQCKAEEHAANLTPKRSIKKYHLNYQPSIAIKRRLKKGITTY